MPKYKIIWKYSVSFLSKSPQVWSENQVEHLGNEEEEEDDDDSAILELDSSMNSTNSRKCLAYNENRAKKAVLSQAAPPEQVLITLDEEENNVINRSFNNSVSNNVSQIVKESKQIMTNLICNNLHCILLIVR